MNKPEKKRQSNLSSNPHICFENQGYNESCDDHKAYFKYLLSKMPSDEQMLRSPSVDYATAYYQGKFDLLMDLLGKIKDSDG